MLTASGFPDAQIRRGMYHRAANKSRPYLNSREGIAPAMQRGEPLGGRRHDSDGVDGE